MENEQQQQTPPAVSGGGWVLHMWLHHKDSPAERRPLESMGVSRSMLCKSYRLDSRSAQGKIERRSISLLMNRPIELMSDEEIREFRETLIVFALVLHDQPAGEWDFDASPRLQVRMPLFEALASPLDWDDPMREFADGEMEHNVERNDPFTAMARYNQYPWLAPHTSWSHPLQVQNTPVRRKDREFFVRRLKATTELFLRMLEIMERMSADHVKRLKDLVAAKYGQYLEAVELQKQELVREREKAEAEGLKPGDEGYPTTEQEPKIASQSAVVRRVIGHFLQELSKEMEDLPEGDPRAEMLKEARDLWQRRDEDMPDDQAGVYNTITYPMGFVELDIVTRPPLGLPGGTTSEWNARRRTMHSVAVNRRWFPEGWLGLKPAPLLETDHKLIHMLERMSLVTRDKQTDEMMGGQAVREFVSRMRPCVYPGAGRYFWLDDCDHPGLVLPHHLVLSYFVVPEEPTAPCTNELVLPFVLDHPLIGRGKGQVTVPWRRLAQQAGLVDEEDGMDANVECFRGEKGAKAITMAIETLSSKMEMDNGEEWTLTANAMPMMFPLPVVVRPMIDRKVIGNQLLDKIAPRDDDGGSSSSSMDHQEEKEPELTQMVMFNGLFVNVVIAPNVHTSQSPIYKNPELFKSALDMHQHFDPNKSGLFY